MTTPQAPTSTYICRYCRQPSDVLVHSCPHCGAPTDVRAVISRSGWVKQPPIKDMARIQFGQSQLQIEGHQVPIADFKLAGPEWIYFGHHTLVWCDPSVKLQPMSMRGGWKRMMSGLPIVMAQASGPGQIGLADSGAGEIVALPLQPGQAIIAREHRFLCATGNVAYDWQASSIWYVTGEGNDQETQHPLGLYEDRFAAKDGPGLVLLHSPGNTFIRDLAAGETILMKPTAMLYRDVSVTAHLHLEYPHTSLATQALGGLLGMAGSAVGELAGGALARRIGRSSWSNRNVWLRLVGPGRVAMQSVFEREESSNYIRSSSPATQQHW
jgi:uncharacterized protein (AIM24 family)